MSDATQTVLVGTGALIELLLKGEFICRTTNEEGWRALKNSSTASGSRPISIKSTVP